MQDCWAQTVVMRAAKTSFWLYPMDPCIWTDPCPPGPDGKHVQCIAPVLLTWDRALDETRHPVMQSMCSDVPLLAQQAALETK